MDKILIEKIKNDKKMYELLKENSYWIKELNRNPDSYKKFVSDMKAKYHLRITDKVSEAIDNIDLISTIIDSIK